MLEKFSADAQVAVKNTISIARSLDHRQILPEHLLLALASNPGSAAARALAHKSVSVPALRAAFASRLPGGSVPAGGTSGLSTQVQHLLQSAANKAVAGERSNLRSLAEALLEAEYDGVEELLGDFDTSSADVLAELAQIGEDNVGLEAHDTAPGQGTQTDFCRDLTQAARDGKLDPVIGRTSELRRVTQVLARRIKNNPVLVGDPGVGKTAIAEGLAIRIVEGNVPAALKDRPVLQVDLAGMVAGTRYRGDFEERLKTLMKGAKESNAILFIDEIHTIVGAGAASSSIDAGQMLKESLARGELTLMGATTIKEYRKNIESDAALERRFTPVQVNEPAPVEVLEIVQRLASKYESHHGISYAPEALEAAVTLATKHIRSRFNPDKAIDVIDEAGASLAIEAMLDENLPKLVSVEHVREVVSQIAGVSVGAVDEDERATLRDLGTCLAARVVGQTDAVNAVARSVRRRRSGMATSQRPASFLFAGPTGVGKTELAKTLSAALFSDLKSGRGTLIRFDMSEFSEKHNVARLFGAPPGYVGYDEGGQLTEAVRRNPASVVLLDEIDKAHPDVFDTLLQVLDDGRMTDGQGRVISFADTVIILTTNFGAREVSRGRAGFGSAGSAHAAHDAVAITMNVLKQSFRPEFLNRLDDVLVFNALGPDLLDDIARTMVSEVVARAMDLGVALTVTDAALAELVSQGTSVEYGARPLRRAVERLLADQVTDAILDETGTLLTADVTADGKVVVTASELLTTHELEPGLV